MTKSFKKPMFFVFALILICMILLTTDTADAAVKYQRVHVLATDTTENIENSTVGYVWSEHVFTDNGSKTNYYYSKTLDGKKTKFASGAFLDQLPNDFKILTNGSKIYFSFEKGSTSEARKGRIYCGSTKGGTPKLLKTVNVKADERITLLGIYNGNLYFQIADPSKTYTKKTPLYRLNLESKKLKKVSTDFNATYGYASGSGRYIYGESLCKDGIRIFDCKTNKIVRTIKEGRKVRTDKGKLYYSTENYEKNYTRIYCASLSGANSKLLIDGLPYDTTVDWLSADLICYQTWVEDANPGLHIYIPETGEDKIVDGDVGDTGSEYRSWYSL